MSTPYDDIIHLPHHVSETRSRMSAHDRAAQFSPFAALTGYEESIEEMRRIVDAPAELDVDGIAMVDEKLRLLAGRLEEKPLVTLTCFVPDSRKQGGAYVSVTGYVKRVDPHEKAVLLTDGKSIPFARIYDVE